MEFTERGFMTVGVDPAWNTAVERTPEYSADATSPPTRTRRLSDPAVLPLDDGNAPTAIAGLPSRPPLSKVINQMHRPSQSHDYDARVGRPIAATSRKIRRPATPKPRSVSATPITRIPYPLAVHEPFDPILVQKLQDFPMSSSHGQGYPSDRDDGRRIRPPGGSETSHEDEREVRGRYVTQPGNISNSSDRRPNPRQSPDSTSRRRKVHRKAVPKLDFDAEEKSVSIELEAVRRRTDKSMERQRLPRPSALI